MSNWNTLPHIKLGVYPTPFYRLENISRIYNKSIWIKRDDLCGVALGGNKVRKLEYLLADAQQQGCDTVFTTGGAQSNHAMLTAACAAHLGMQCTLILKKRGVTDHKGNLVLDDIFGAQVEFMDTDSYEDIYAEMRKRCEILAANGRKGYIIPVGGSTALGAIGYAECVREMAEQAKEAGIEISHVASATGSGGTTAGLVLGTSLFLPQAKATGLGVDTDPFEEIVSELVKEAVGLVGQPVPTDMDSRFRMIYHVGAGYAIPNAEDTPLHRGTGPAGGYPAGPRLHRQGLGQIPDAGEGGLLRRAGAHRLRPHRRRGGAVRHGVRLKRGVHSPFRFPPASSEQTSLCLACLMAGRIPFCLFFLSPRKPLCWVFAGAYVRTGERA